MQLHPALEQTMDQLEALYDRESDVIGVATGYHDLDDMLLGLQPSTLVDRRGPSRPGEDLASRSGMRRNTSR